MSIEGSIGPEPHDLEDLDPRRPENRPGLAEIAYRIGTHSAFLRRMLWRIPRQNLTDPVTNARLRPLLGLTARETSDPSIALMDTWAAALDVLSFYSERIANEGYLPTASERRSMVELARTIGYELAHGVAASTHLAFTVEDADDPYRAVEVPAGTQAMSVPQEKGALPQVYETSEAILARAEWNAIPARAEEPQHIALYWDPANPADDRNGKLFLFDLDNSFDLDAAFQSGDLDPSEVTTTASAADLSPYHPLAAGLDLVAALEALQDDAALNPEIDPTLKAIEINETYLRGTGLGLAEGDRLLAVGAQRDDTGAQIVAAAPFRVVEAEPERAYNLTRTVIAPIGERAPQSRRRLPKLRTAKLRIGTVTNTAIDFNAATVNRQVKRTAWTGATFSAFLKIQRWPRLQLMRLIRQPDPVEAPALREAVPGFYALRQRAGFFGNSAPRHETLADPTESRGGPGKDPYPDSWDAAPRTVWSDSQGKVNTDAHVFLEREIDEIAPEQWALLESPAGVVLPLRVAAAAGASRADFAINGKATGVTFRRMDDNDIVIPLINGEGTVDVENLAADLQPYTFRTARAHVVSEHLAIAGAPIREDLLEGATELALNTLYLDLEPGRSVSVSGERGDAPGVTESETLAIDNVFHIGGITRIMFESGPTFRYRRPTVRVNANVALATHGETQEEQIGSGNAARTNQAFELSKKPLTLVSAATESGIATTLSVRVEGVEWTEVPSLLDAGPNDEIYQVRIDNDRTTRVVFGDGQRGRRLPTGQLNVSASYRAGIGAVGEAVDESITQLKTRPLGIRAVVNPSPAMGSAEPEGIDDARARAPQSVRTLGRIVSLTDYADFARSFAGVGKAVSTALWFGQERIAHLTVAPEAEGVFGEDATTLANLRDAVAKFRNQTHRVEVAPHTERLFKLTATLTHDDRHLPEDVEAAARQALIARFGYQARALAQSVSAAEVVAALQGVNGVVAVDLDDLSLYVEGAPDAPLAVANRLRACPARVERNAEGRETIHAAELLTLLVSSADLTPEAENA